MFILVHEDVAATTMMAATFPPSGLSFAPT
jgi:hypothetical protein